MGFKLVFGFSTVWAYIFGFGPKLIGPFTTLKQNKLTIKKKRQNCQFPAEKSDTVEKSDFWLFSNMHTKLNPCLKKFTITLNLLATKKSCMKRGKL